MKGKWILGLIVLLILVGGAFWFLRRKQGNGDTEITAIKVKKGSIEDIVESTGEVAPLNRVAIQPAVAGRIESLLVDEGDKVKAGQTLALMSSTSRVAIMDAARAQGPDVLKKWQDDYKPIPVVSPISGLVILNNVVVGQMVDTTVTIYALSDTLILIAQVDETDIGRIKIGMPARIILDAYPDHPGEGKVFDILYEGVNTSNIITYNVKIKPTNGVPPFFRSQMTANVDFIVKKKDDALLIPAAAVTQSHGQYQVLIPGPDGKPVVQSVTLGIEGSDKDEVVDGLNEGDTVLLTHKRYVPQQAQSSPLVGNTSNHGGGGHGGH